VIDDQGNVTVYLYDDLNRKVAETGGLTVNSTLTNANLLGPRVIPTPTAATINNPSSIPAAEVDAQLAEAKARLNAVAPLFPSQANRVDDHPPTTRVWGYDPDNNVLISQDENGSETFAKYDAINRPIAVRVFRAGQNDSFAGDPVFAPAPVNPIPTNPSRDDEPTPTVVVGTTKQNIQYDGLSRRTLATDNNDPTTAADDSTATDAYDSLGRVIEEAQTIGGQPTKVISSAWRADALRSKLTYPNGRAEVYTYDHLDRLKSVSDQGAAQPIATYDYIGVNRVLDRVYPQNGTRETFLDNSGTVDIGYDGLRRPVDDRTLRADNSLVVSFTYVYDRMNYKLDEVKLHDAKDSEFYAYDSAYRLVSFTRAAGGIAPLQSHWTLDGAGNWTQVDGETRQHSSFNEITARTVGGTTTAVRSDDNGNETDDGTYLYTWDSMNRLRTVIRKSDNALVAVYSYDALGRRIQKVVPNSGGQNDTTDFEYDGWRSIEEWNGVDALVQQYVFGAYIDEPLVMDRNLNGDGTATGPGDERLFYNQNTLYNVYALTDTAGKIVEGYQYDAYGRPAVFDAGANGVVDFGGDDVVTPGGRSAVGNPYLFTGMRLDVETGVYDDRARYMDPVLGRFISRDPLGAWADAQNSGNAYAYVGDSPENAQDPFGLLLGSCRKKTESYVGCLNRILGTDRAAELVISGWMLAACGLTGAITGTGGAALGAGVGAIPGATLGVVSCLTLFTGYTGEVITEALIGCYHYCPPPAPVYSPVSAPECKPQKCDCMCFDKAEYFGGAQHYYYYVGVGEAESDFGCALMCMREKGTWGHYCRGHSPPPEE
jgi:RHS repeat-associated protein